MGEQNKKREYPYTVVTHYISNYSCLDLVFVKTEKIDNIEEYLDRLGNKCGIDFVALMNRI
jgi:hypothetical protein